MKPSYQKALNYLGVKTLEDLISYFPRDYQDLTIVSTIAQARPNEKVTIRARIKKIAVRYGKWRRMSIVEGLLEDQTGNIVAVWFNQPFLRHTLQEGREYYFYGKAQIYARSGQHSLQLAGPTFEIVKDDTIHTAGIIPVYELTAGITQKQLRYWLKSTLDGLGQIEDHLPELLRAKLHLPRLQRAIRDIHFPKNYKATKEARDRLAFDELFVFQLALLSYKRKLKTFPAPPIPLRTEIVAEFVKTLPFKLTHSQRLAVWEILRDLSGVHPMNRLLEGDVGSGKTVVAGLAMLCAAACDYQAVLLAPTEILAFQHYQTLLRLYQDSEFQPVLLTRSHKHGDIEGVASGRAKIVIGTHALLQEKIRFKRIGLLVVDEQHRFGVKQRSRLLQGADGSIPHLLSMSATPIPRTLALAFYGDLDISKLSEQPAGRKPIVTRLILPENRFQAYEFIRQEIERGRQAYIITPLIDESDKIQLRSAMLEAARLQKDIFPHLSIGLLHGQMKGEEKRNVMDKFKDGEHHILVSTTVVEVGVDVPNATVMVIENAERFGLSQLHQLRGRVGRSEHQSYCFLFAENMNPTTKKRLEAVVRCGDGFKLAEIDLELRGSGEIIGTRQSGFIPFRLARLSDSALIKKAKEQAEQVLDREGFLDKYPNLLAKVQMLANITHLE